MRLELLKFTKITNADPVQTTVQIFYDTELLADDEDQLIDFNSNEYIPSYKKKKRQERNRHFYGRSIQNTISFLRAVRFVEETENEGQNLLPQIHSQER
jgi:hypothetical protein